VHADCLFTLGVFSFEHNDFNSFKHSLLPELNRWLDGNKSRLV